MSINIHNKVYFTTVSFPDCIQKLFRSQTYALSGVASSPGFPLVLRQRLRLGTRLLLHVYLDKHLNLNMGDVWRHWLVPVSCVFYHGLYFLLRRFIVRGVCDPILREQCRHHGSMDAGSRRLANGFTAKPPSPGLGNGVDVKGVSGSACAQRSKLSDGEVADIAAK